LIMESLTLVEEAIKYLVMIFLAGGILGLIAHGWQETWRGIRWFIEKISKKC